MQGGRCRSGITQFPPSPGRSKRPLSPSIGARHLPQVRSWRPELIAHQEEDSDCDWSQWLAEADANEGEGKGRLDDYDQSQ